MSVRHALWRLTAVPQHIADIKTPRCWRYCKKKMFSSLKPMLKAIAQCPQNYDLIFYIKQTIHFDYILSLLCSSVFSADRTLFFFNQHGRCYPRLSLKQTGLCIRTPGILPSLTPGILPSLTLGILPSLTLGILPSLTLGILPSLTLGILPSQTPGILPSQTPGILPSLTREHAANQQLEIKIFAQQKCRSSQNCPLPF